jgi:hypothetical protein
MVNVELVIVGIATSCLSGIASFILNKYQSNQFVQHIERIINPPQEPTAEPTPREPISDAFPAPVVNPPTPSEYQYRRPHYNNPPYMK